MPLPSSALSGNQITLESVRQVLEGGTPLKIPGYATSTNASATPSDSLLLPKPASPSFVINTSGSTGNRKRVAFSSEALVNSAKACLSVIGRGQWVLCLPRHYTAGLSVLVRSILCSTIPVDISEEKFSTESFMRACKQLSEKQVFTSLVPTQLASLVKSAEVDKSFAKILADFTGILVGGQHIPEPLLERSRALGLKIITSYGLTETLGGCVYNRLPLPGVQLRIIQGRLAIGSPNLALGYLMENGQIDETGFFHANGERWFHTNDLASLDHGKLKIHGRSDRVINSGGIKLDLEELENALRALDCLVDAVLVDIDSEKWGQGFCAFIDIGSAQDNRKDVLERIHAFLANFGPVARAGEIRFIHPLPRTFSGKPDREALRNLLHN